MSNATNLHATDLKTITYIYLSYYGHAIGIQSSFCSKCHNFNQNGMSVLK